MRGAERDKHHAAFGLQSEIEEIAGGDEGRARQRHERREKKVEDELLLAREDLWWRWWWWWPENMIALSLPDVCRRKL